MTAFLWIWLATQAIGVGLVWLLTVGLGRPVRLTETPRVAVLLDGQRRFAAVGARALPQGACTSPAITNLVCRRMDARLAGAAARLGFTYTRYADDLTFSGPRAADAGAMLDRIRFIATDEGFAEHPKKTRVLRPESRQMVTGLVVNAAPAVPRRMVRRLRAILHRAKKEGLAAQNRQGHPNFRGWVEGMIAYVAMARPDVGRALRSALDKVAGP